MAIGIITGILLAVFAIIAFVACGFLSDNGNDGGSAIAALIGIK